MIKSHELVSYLFTYGQLVLPGIGTLYIENISAKKRQHEFKIYGPKIKFGIKDTSRTEQIGLTGWLTSKFSNDDAKVQEILDELKTSYMAGISEHREIRIPHLGRVYLNDKNKYEFESDEQLFKSFEMAYPDLALHMISIPWEKIPEGEKQVKAQDIKTHAKKSVPWLICFAGMVLTALLLSLAIHFFTYERPHVNEPQGKPAESEGSKDPIVSYPDTFAQDLQTDIPQSYPDVPEEEDIPAAETNRQVKPIPPAPINVEDTKMLFEELDQMVYLSVEKRNAMSYPCIIVAGSFKKVHQVQKMLNKLEQKGYDTYLEKYKSFYRTGIIIDCDSSQIDSIMSVIKSEIEKDAWILSE